MKRLLFIILKNLSYCLRPLRHGIYLQVLQKAYELQGIRFHGRIGYIHHDAFIDNLGTIEIGDNVVISTRAILLAHDYSPRVKQMLNGGGESNYVHSLTIGNNVFVGAGAILLPETNIGDYCIIGAGAVVKGEIPDYSVVVGNPAKIIKTLK